jgi:2-oxoglutarate dehydrogenase E1 component
MAQLDGYKTGGTIHIMSSNQVGFTTDYQMHVLQPDCTDVAKVTLSPVLHVNAQMIPQTVVHATSFC